MKVIPVSEAKANLSPYDRLCQEEPVSECDTPWVTPSPERKAAAGVWSGQMIGFDPRPNPRAQWRSARAMAEVFRSCYNNHCITASHLETLVVRNPFPGMGPYLEQFWGDVHHTMINRSRAAIQKQLPTDLVARVDERVFVEPSVGLPRNIIPHVKVVERGGREKPVLRASNGLALAEPLVIQIAQDEPTRQGFIEIIDIKLGRRVVTVIEIVSPSNKVAGPGRDLYVKKQGELREAGVSLVEIDLNRTGSRVLSVPSELIPTGHRTPYAACVRRGWKPLAFDYYRLPLRERLPAIAVPLRQTDPEIPLDLQSVLDECCEEGRYVDDIDYREEPDPPLAPEDTRWADTLLREQGLR